MDNFHVIYDSERGAVLLFYSPRGKTAVFKFAPVINPVKTAQIKKGMKIFDYENAYFFSLSLPESLVVNKLLTADIKKDVSIGSISCKIDPKTNGKTIKIAHFPQKKDERTKDNIIVSELSLSIADNPLKGATLSYKKLQNKQVLTNISIRVSYPDFLTIRSFIEKHSDFIVNIHSIFMYDRLMKGSLTKNINTTRIDDDTNISENEEVIESNETENLENETQEENYIETYDDNDDDQKFF